MDYFKYILSLVTLFSYLNLNGMNMQVVSVEKGFSNLQQQEEKCWHQADLLLKKSQRNEQEEQNLKECLNRGIASQIKKWLPKKEQLNLGSKEKQELQELVQIINATLNL